VKLLGYTHMGGEGANWIGEAPFSTREHVFQNLGDGTYNHSGVQAIRFALIAGTNITYKILYNDAVAMTGGQKNEGDLSPEQIARELLAMGVKHVAVVHDPQGSAGPVALPPGGRDPRARRAGQRPEEVQHDQGRLGHHLRSDLRGRKAPAAQTRTVSRPRPPRLHQHRCLRGLRRLRRAVELRVDRAGRDRAGPQTRHRPVELQQGFQLPQGLLPVLRDGRGRALKKEATAEVEIGDLPSPDLPKIDGTHNVVITGVGGTGVVTIGAVMAMAAHIDGKGAGMMEMAGLAQKGGAVHIHCRIAERPEDISAIRVATGECDALIGGDLVVSAGAKTLGLMRTGRTGAVVNSHETVTGEFTRNTEFRIPADRLELALQARIKDRLTLFDASELARVLMGDTIYSNMMVFGAAWQRGFVPLRRGGDRARDRAERRGGGAQQARLRDRALGGAEPRGGRADHRAQGGGKAEDAGGEDRLPRGASDGLPVARGWRGATARSSTGSRSRGSRRRSQRGITSCWPTRTNTRSRGCISRPRRRRGRSSTAI
jgi:indolepyruvate ferredoxin oxidoreductase